MNQTFIIYKLIILIITKLNYRISIASVIHNGQSHNVCNTVACKNIASDILNNIDNSVKPCDNFYRFVCGKFLKKTNITNDQTTMSVFTAINDKVQEQLRNSLEDPSPLYEGKPFKLSRDFYKSCINEDVIEQRGHKFLLEKLKELGGWPVLDGHKWDEANFNWIKLVYKFRNVGYPLDFFMSITTRVNLKDTSKKILVFDQPPQVEIRDIMTAGINSVQIKAYYKYMVDIAVLLGAIKNNATRQLEESLRFEVALAQITQSNLQLRNFTLVDNKMTIKELSEKYPCIEWKEYINNILSPYVTVNDDEIVVITAPSFISAFDKLISTTPKRVQANYIIWKAVDYSVQYLTQRMLQKWLEYSSTWNGIFELKPRWKKCIETVRGLFSTNALYVKKYFNTDMKIGVNKMFYHIKRQFNDILQTIDWMDNETKQKALDKATSITSFIGYPDQLLNDSVLQNLYDNLDINDNNYLENALNLHRFILNEEYSNFRKSVVKGNWKDQARVSDVDAYYDGSSNSINFPAGILQETFYNCDRPKYINYGAIGSMIGHEIIHGFDDQGRQFDKYGNLNDWWMPFANEKFLKKAQCIINQYSNYTVEENGKKLNGINTQGENIADNGGFKIAYLAYKDWAKKHNVKEEKLPGLQQYNSQQMFWISSANVWCSKYRPNYLKNMIVNNPHCPSEFRIIGSFSNLPEFAEDFNCPVGSKMNPEQKCIFW